jgi:hypothetical protein
MLEALCFILGMLLSSAFAVREEKRASHRAKPQEWLLKTIFPMWGKSLKQGY